MKQLFYFIFGVLTTLMLLLIILKENYLYEMPILSKEMFDYFWSEKTIPLRASIVLGFMFSAISWLLNTGKGIENGEYFENESQDDFKNFK